MSEFRTGAPKRRLVPLSHGSSSEVWAIVDDISGAVWWTLGGSSTKSRMMVYASEAKARASLRYAPAGAVVRRIYVSDDVRAMDRQESLHWHDKGI